MAGNWCLIESDPGVFTELLKGFGVKGVQVEELYSLDESEFHNLRPIVGLVFLFKWRPGDEPSGTPIENENNIFFAQQVIQNACATQALVNMLLNVKNTKVELGQILTDYRDFAKDFDPGTKGLTLSNSDQIREVHNSFARQTQYELDVKGGKEEDNYHFISYIPFGDKVLELDGLRDFPLEVAQVKEGSDWLDAVRPVIQMRIQKYSEGEIHFNLMAVITDRKSEFLRRIEEIVSKPEPSIDDEQVLQELQVMLEAEDEKMKRYRQESVRRRHNYLPFLLELLKCLAREGKLVPLVEEAQQLALKRAGKKEE